MRVKTGTELRLPTANAKAKVAADPRQAGTGYADPRRAGTGRR